MQMKSPVSYAPYMGRSTFFDDSRSSAFSDCKLARGVLLQRHAALQLRLLAKIEENRLRIATASAVKPLISLVQSPDTLLKEHGVTTILNLSL